MMTEMIATQPLIYYAHQSTITDPGKYAKRFNGLPDDLPGLHQIVQNLYIHVWKIRKYHPDWLKGRTHEIDSRVVSRSLSLVVAHDDRPFTEERPKEQKLIIDCRHFATLLCSLLRHKGIPARVRCGFATYLEESHYQDHWITEYWNGERWVMEDPDLKMHDVTAEQFITGGRAWQMIKSGEISDVQFGFSPHDRGAWVVYYDLVRDLAAINNMEMLSSDAWGILDKKYELISRTERAMLDEAARWSLVGNDEFEGMRNFYENTPLLRVPEIVERHNYVVSKSEWVKWDDRI